MHCRHRLPHKLYRLLTVQQSARGTGRWADLVLNARQTSAFSLCKASPTARTQRSSQPHRAPSPLAAVNMHTDDGTAAGWANWVKPPDSSRSEDASRKQTPKRARSPGHKGKRPNFFFALQVSQSAAVTAAIKSVHDSLVQHARDLQAALVEPETAHLTVMVTALISEEEIQHAEAAMESFADQLAADAAWTKPLALTLEGLSHFRHQVLYLDIKKDLEHDRLLELAKAFRDHMQASGVEVSDNRDFTGHVTIAKLSKIRTKKRKSGVKLKKIAEAGYAQQLSIRAGEALVTELQLCQMQGREAGAYYKVQRSVAFCRQSEQ